MLILPVIAIMIGFALVGLVLRGRGLLGTSASKRLNEFVLDVTLPAGIFNSLHHFHVVRTTLLTPLLAGAVTFVLWGLALLVVRWLKLDGSQRAVFLLAVSFGNTAFLGYPLVSAVFGEQGLARAVLIDQVGVELISFTLGAVIAASGAQEGGTVAWGSELRQLARFPPLVTLVVALLWQLLGLPQVPPLVGKALHLLSSLTAPLVMIALGLVLRLGSLRRTWRWAAVVSVLRLVVSPALMWGVAVLFGVHGLDRAVATVEFAMPTMMFTLVLALRYGLDAELSAAFITATLVGSIVTLPVWTALVAV